MNKVGKWFVEVWRKVVYPALKLAKPALRKWARKVLIPELQKQVDAGAIDAVVDEKIEKIILDMINKI